MIIRKSEVLLSNIFIQPSRMLFIAAINAIAAVLGCVSHWSSSDIVVLKVNPVIEYYPLGKLSIKSDGVFVLLNQKRI